MELLLAEAELEEEDDELEAIALVDEELVEVEPILVVDIVFPPEPSARYAPAAAIIKITTTITTTATVETERREVLLKFLRI